MGMHTVHSSYAFRSLRYTYPEAKWLDMWSYCTVHPSNFLKYLPVFTF